MLQLTAAHGIPNANGNGGEIKQDECAPKTHLRSCSIVIKKGAGKREILHNSRTAAEDTGKWARLADSSLLLQLLAKSMGDAGLHNHSKFGP